MQLVKSSCWFGFVVQILFYSTHIYLHFFACFLLVLLKHTSGRNKWPTNRELGKYTKALHFNCCNKICCRKFFEAQTN